MTTRPAGLTLSYVTMGFPAPSETFTSHDVREIARAGADLTVHALRPPHPWNRRLLRERGLEQVHVTHATGGSPFRGLVVALSIPIAAAALVALLFRTSRHQPRLLLRSLVLLPRAFEVYGEIRRAHAQVVHLCWAHYPCMVGFLVERALPSVALSISFSAYDIDLRYGLTAPVAEAADWLRTLSDENVAEIESAFGVAGSRIAVIPDGIPIELFEKAAGERIRGRVVTVGRLDPEKGMADVIEAFALVAKEAPFASLELLGGGREAADLARRVSELNLNHVTFAGHQPQEVVAQALGRAEVFLFLSLTERVPNVVKEAMAAGCACVVSRTFAITDLIPDEAHGRVVRIGDIGAAADACLGYLNCPALRAATGAAGHAWIAERYSLRATVPAYLSAWCMALKTKGSPYVRD